jgi:hypothetical protein
MPFAPLFMSIFTTKVGTLRTLGWLIRSCYDVVFLIYDNHTARYSIQS